MKTLKLAAAALLSSVYPPAVFANSNAGSTLLISTTPAQFDLDRAGFEAMTYIPISAVGSRGEAGATTNILTYDTWDTKVAQKAKGITDAGSPEVEVARIATDPGQKALKAAALTNLNYAFKELRNDPASLNGVGTVFYNRGLVTGPSRPGGRNEDFDLEVYTLAFNQLEVVVDPTAGGVAPTNTVAPAAPTGTAKVGQTLTAVNGTFTGDAVITYSYQWFVGGVAVPGANAGTYVPVVGDIGKIVTVRVTGTNASGSALAMSAATSAVIA